MSNSGGVGDLPTFELAAMSDGDMRGGFGHNSGSTTNGGNGSSAQFNYPPPPHDGPSTKIYDGPPQYISVPPPNHRNRKMVFIAMMSCLAAVIVAFGAVLLVPVKLPPPSEEDASGGFPPTTASGSGSDGELHKIHLKDPPEELTAFCSMESIASVSGFDMCEELCESAVCCRLPETDDYSCKHDNSLVCKRYDADCSNLDTARDEDQILGIPVAPQNLSDLCAADPLLRRDTKAEQCIAFCSQAHCCYRNIRGQNCTHQHQHLCQGYAPCSILLTSSTTAQQTEQKITQLSQQQHNQEENQPQTPPPTDPSIDQKQQQTQTSNDPSISNTNTAINAACTDNGYGMQELCQALCQPGACCFHDGEDSCFHSGIDVDCHDYIPCEGKYQTSTDHSTSSSSSSSSSSTKALVDTECNNVADATIDGAMLACEAICQPADCCFQRDQNNCFNTAVSINCHDYTSCAKLYTNNNQDQDDGSQSKNTADTNNDGILSQDEENNAIVDELCKPSSLYTLNSLEDCHDICEPYLCCFSSDPQENCYADHASDCDVHESCDILVRPWHYIEFNNFPPSHDDSPPFITKELVDEACSKSNLQTTDGIAACHALCAPKLCCFVGVGMKSHCEDEVTEGQCTIYDSCQDLIDDEDEDNDVPTDQSLSLPSNLQEESDTWDVNFVCSDDSVQTELGKMKCAYTCARRRCCFVAGPGNCYVTDSDWCDEYSECEALEDFDNQEHEEDIDGP